MKPADQPGAVRYTAPGCFDLPVRRVVYEDGSRSLVTAWELSAAEVAEVNRTGRIWLSIVGDGHPPVLLTIRPPWDEQP